MRMAVMPSFLAASIPPEVEEVPPTVLEEESRVEMSCFLPSAVLAVSAKSVG